jgi:hypothetical protein
MTIPPEAYSVAISLVGMVIQTVQKWIAAKSGKSVEEVRADIKKELDDTDAELEADRAAEHKRFDNS